MTNIFQLVIFNDAKREQSYKIATNSEISNLDYLYILITKTRNNEPMTSVKFKTWQSSKLLTLTSMLNNASSINVP